MEVCSSDSRVARDDAAILSRASPIGWLYLALLTEDIGLRLYETLQKRSYQKRPEQRLMGAATLDIPVPRKGSRAGCV